MKYILGFYFVFCILMSYIFFLSFTFFFLDNNTRSIDKVLPCINIIIIIVIILIHDGGWVCSLVVSHEIMSFPPK